MILAVAILLVGSIVLLGLAAGGCENRITQIALSPNKDKAAVVFQRNCGATTPFSTQVALVEANRIEEVETGNVLSTELGPELVHAQWRDESSLAVKVAGKPRWKVVSVDGTRIHYE